MTPIFPLHINIIDAKWRFWEACVVGDLGLVRYYIDHGADIHDWNERALYLATYNGHPRIVRFLLENGARPYADGEGGARDIGWAEYFRYIEIIDLLTKALN